MWALEEEWTEGQGRYEPHIRNDAAHPAFVFPVRANLARAEPSRWGAQPMIHERDTSRSGGLPRAGDCSRPLTAELAAEIDGWYRDKEFVFDWTSAHFPGWTAVFASFRARPLRILEIGSYEGRSAVFFLNYFSGSTLVCIDLWNTSALEPDIVKRLPEAVTEAAHVEGRFDRNLSQFSSRLTKIAGNSSDVLPQLGLQSERFDLIYVDGDHKSAPTYRDCTLAWPLLKSNGILVIDDYEFDLGLPEENRPKRGVDAFLRSVSGQYEELHRAYQIIIRRC
jgi:predicted O-methyltransferase YrrM